MTTAKQGAFLGRVEAALSAARMGRFYVSASEPDWEPLARYEWNVAICEAFYPLIHHLEVVLRNSVSRFGSAAYPFARFEHIPSWLDAVPSPLHPGYGARDILKAKQKLFGTDRTTGALLPPARPYKEGDLVAALDFGFWTGLFNPYYRGRSARDKRLWPHGLPVVFPHAVPAPGLAEVSTRLNELRHLRNRVFHHEPVWKRKLAEDRDNIFEVIGWISPEALRVLRSMERVTEVISDDFRRKVRVRVYRESRR
jgi:hypothetical protein